MNRLALHAKRVCTLAWVPDFLTETDSFKLEECFCLMTGHRNVLGHKFHLEETHPSSVLSVKCNDSIKPHRDTDSVSRKILAQWLPNTVLVFPFDNPVH